MKPQWLSAGLDALRKGGVAAVRVERLAAGVGVTKGSFYHHFRDRGALLEALLEFWSREMTDAEFERIQTVRGGLGARLLALAHRIVRGGGLRRRRGGYSSPPLLHVPARRAPGALAGPGVRRAREDGQ